MTSSDCDQGEFISVQLLTPKKWFENPMKLATQVLYVASLALVVSFGIDAARQYSSLSAAEKALEYPNYKIDAFKEMGVEPPPLSASIINGLLYHDVALRFRAVLFVLLVPVAVHITSIILEFWVDQIRARVSFASTKDPHVAMTAFVVPKKGSGRPCFLKMYHEVQLRVQDGTDRVVATSPDSFIQIAYFYFQQKKYIWSPEAGTFLSASQSMEAQQVSLGKLLQSASRGLTSSEHSKTMFLYGENRLAPPLLTLGHLFVEHILSPLFMFQIFTAVLWLFDDFAIYSFFTSIMLLFMEGGNILTKYNRMKESRQMISNPCLIEVCRDGEWQIVPSTSLVPGDLVRYTVETLQQAMEQQAAQEEKHKKTSNKEHLKQMGIPAIHILLSRIRHMFFSGEYPAENYAIMQSKQELRFSTHIPADLLITKNVAVVDESLLTGESAVQMKDSVWDGDVLLGKTLDEAHEIPFNQDREAGHMLYAGTVLASVGTEPVHAIVLRTGFEMSQGQLIRKVLFDEERSSTVTKDAMQFLLIMFVIACIAGGYTFWRGYVTKICPLNRLILESMIVFVSVIPPELSMEVSMTVSASLQELRKFFIYCTEPFKIMNAGKLRICCFDKTGTLCDCGVDIVGLILNSPNHKKKYIDSMVSFKDLTKSANKALENGKFSQDVISHVVLSSAQGLFVHKGKLVGDPLEQAIYADNETYKLNNNGTIILGLTAPCEITIIKRFALSNRLKRMSVVAEVKCDSKHISKTLVAIKGAPEVIKSLCVPGSVPEWHDDCLNELASQGYRILTFAYREMENYDGNQTRTDVEQSLTFVGFIITDSSLKSDTREAIEIIKSSGHRCAVISGDNIISVSVVSMRAGIMPQDQPVYSLEDFDNTTGRCTFTRLNIVFQEPGPLQAKTHPLQLVASAGDIKELSRKYSFAATNDASFVDLLADKKHARDFIPRFRIFSRMTPEQKADIIRVMQSTAPTLFCGDGSNDVEGLRSADVGVALWEAADYKEKKAEADLAESSAQESARIRRQKIQDAISQLPRPSIMGPGGTPASQQTLYIEACRRSGERRTKVTDEMRYLIWEQNKYWTEVRKISRSGSASFLDKLFGMSNDGLMSGWSQAFDIEDDGKGLQLGDAAIAAPFTAKSGTLGGVLDIIRQGRCSLVTLIMTYKTLALKCIVGAYSMSVLTLDGIRYSEQQLMASGMAQMFILLNINKAKPLKKLSRTPAPKNIISAYALTSLACQIIVHILMTTVAVKLVSTEKTTVPFHVKFQPSLVNTVVFILSMYQDLAINVINYPGEPFMLSLLKSKKLWRGVIIFVAATLILNLQVFPELNEALGLIPMDARVQQIVFVVGLLNVAICFVIEKASFYLFGPKPLPDDDI